MIELRLLQHALTLWQFQPPIGTEGRRAGRRREGQMTFLCTDRYCLRYMRGGRGNGEPDTGTNHVGFRCVRDPARAAAHAASP
jgi:hypothetical protein